MRKTNKKQLKTTTKQKIELILFGILLALIILELSLRIGGFVVSSYQRSGNKMTSNLDDSYHILCLGESTTADLYGNQNSWPAQLEIVLNNRSSEIKFKVFNEGVGGTNTAFILSHLEDNLNKYTPHMVITMMGVNDKGLNIKYDETPKVKIALLLEDLRVYKLSKLLWMAWKNKIKNNTTENINTAKELKLIEEKTEYIELGRNYQEQGKFKEAEDMLKKAIEINPNDDEAYIEIGCIYHEEGRFEEAEDMFKIVIEINSGNYEAHTELGWIYWEEDRFKEAEDILKKAIEINPNDDEAYVGLGRVYWEEYRLKEAEDMLKKAIEINPNDDEIYTLLIHIYHEQGVSDKEIEEFYRKRGVLIKVQENISTFDITKYHYHKLYKELNKRGIKYIAMQYPTLNINELKEMFEGNEDITFISNKKNFREALETIKYEEYFIDRFAGDFGHCTPKGNRLIAENAAGVILKELNIS